MDLRPGTVAVIRTSFADDDAWVSVVADALRPSAEGFQPVVQVVDDPALADLDTSAAVALLPADYTPLQVMVVDEVTLGRPDHPVLLVDLGTGGGANRGRSFRFVPTEMWSVQNNLSLANMDLDDFAGSTGPDGVHRGF